jgi:hypothetical protein
MRFNRFNISRISINKTFAHNADNRSNVVYLVVRCNTNY